MSERPAPISSSQCSQSLDAARARRRWDGEVHRRPDVVKTVHLATYSTVLRGSRREMAFSYPDVG